MICITDVEYIETEMDFYVLHEYNPEKLPLILQKSTKPGSKPEKKEFAGEVRTDLVNGQRFVNADGQEVTIGLSKRVQELIGLPFAVFENQQNVISELRSQIQESQRELEHRGNVIRNLQKELSLLKSKNSKVIIKKKGIRMVRI